MNRENSLGLHYCKVICYLRHFSYCNIFHDFDIGFFLCRYSTFFIYMFYHYVYKNRFTLKNFMSRLKMLSININTRRKTSQFLCRLYCEPASTGNVNGKSEPSLTSEVGRLALRRGTLRLTLFLAPFYLRCKFISSKMESTKPGNFLRARCQPR